MRNFTKALASVLILCALAFALSRGLSPNEPWGYSVTQNGPVAIVILQRLPLTIELVVASAVLALAGGAAIALLFRSGRARGIPAGLAMALESLPFFWLALLLQLAAVVSRTVPYEGSSDSDRFDLGDHLSHLALPAVTLALFILPIVLRGMRWHKLAYFLAGAFPEIIGAAVLTDLIFARPGFGRLIVQAANLVDGPLLAGCVLFIALATIAVRSVGGLMPAYPDREPGAQ